MPHILGIPHPKQPIVGGLAGKAINALANRVKQQTQLVPQKAQQPFGQNGRIAGGLVGRAVQAVAPKVQQYVQNRQQYFQQNPLSKQFNPQQFQPKEIAKRVGEVDYNIRTKLLGFGPQLQPPSLPPSFGTAGGVTTALSNSPMLARVGNAVLGQAGKVKLGPTIQNLNKGVGEKERKFITTVKESPLTPPQTAQRVTGNYIPKSNDILVKQAQALIKKDINSARELAESGINDQAVATADQLIHLYSKRGDFVTAAEIANRVAPALTEAGRTIQAASLYNRLSPTGIVRYAANVKQKAGLGGLNPQESKLLNNFAKQVEKMPDGLPKAQKTAELLDEV